MFVCGMCKIELKLAWIYECVVKKIKRGSSLLLVLYERERENNKEMKWIDKRDDENESKSTCGRRRWSEMLCNKNPLKIIVCEWCERKDSEWLGQN